MKTLVLDQRFMRLRYDDVGTGLPVLLLHAFPFDRTMWQLQLEPLANAGYRVLAPDLPEFGDTTPGTEVLRRTRADVIAEFSKRDIEKVVGDYPWGLLWFRAPPPSGSGLLADTKAAPDDSEAKAKRDQLIADVKKGGPVAAAEALLPKLFSETTRAKNPAAIEGARAIVLRQRSAGIIAGLYALRDRPDATPGLASVAVPTLVVVGEHDAVTPPLASARIAGSVPGSELVHIPDAGHLSNIENPEAFNAALIAFLKKL